MLYSANGVIAVGAPGSDARKSENLKAFMTTYINELHNAIRQYPQEYTYPESEVDTVAEKMRKAFIAYTYNKDSRAIRAVCKQLGLKHTYTDINRFLDGLDN